MPVPAPDLTPLRDAIHRAASQRAWSQGVTLAREDRVTGLSASPDEIEVEVRAPARPTPFTAVLYPEDGESHELLLHAADHSMYRAKAAGGGRVVFAGPARDARLHLNAMRATARQATT